MKRQLQRMLADLERELRENDRDIEANSGKQAALIEERRNILRGIEGIHAEIKRMEAV